MKHLFKVMASYKDKQNKWHKRGEIVELDGVESMMPRRNGKLIRISGTTKLVKPPKRRRKRKKSQTTVVEKLTKTGKEK